MTEVKGEGDCKVSVYFKKKGPVQCEIVHNNPENKVKAYLFDRNKIWVYHGQSEKGTEGNPIEEDTQLVKLTIKGDETDPYMYVDFINTHVEGRKEPCPKLGEIMSIINSITTKLPLKISKIMLQDDAHFYCNDKMEYAVKAIYLRALDKDKTDSELSIYEKYGFTTTKTADIQGCIDALRKITCNHLVTASKNILERLKVINYSTTSVYQIHVDHKDLAISYTPIKAHKLRLGPIFSAYKSNLEQLVTLLGDGGGELLIYDFCKVEKSERDSSKSELLRNILSCLEKDVNMNVIIVEGGDSESNGNRTGCDVNIVERAGKEVINITKIFNLFYGTFKKLNYLYNEMEASLELRNIS